MSATDSPRVVWPANDVVDAGTSRMSSRRVSPVLIRPVPISVAPSASTTRPPMIPEARFDAAVAREGVGVLTGISARAIEPPELKPPESRSGVFRQGKLQTGQAPGADRVGDGAPEAAPLGAVGRRMIVRSEAPLAQDARISRGGGTTQPAQALLEAQQRGRRRHVEPQAGQQAQQTVDVGVTAGQRDAAAQPPATGR